MNPIEAVIAPLKDEAIERATQEAQLVIDRVIADLEDANWNLDEVAPYPKSFGCSKQEYRRALAKHTLYSRITTYTKCSRSSMEPDIRKASPKNEKRFIDEAKYDAGLQYDAFVAKLISKVGDVKEATLEGNHVWGYSFLNVVKEQGEPERWKTQMIVNCSKLGKLFNQWPTRKVKIK